MIVRYTRDCVPEGFTIYVYKRCICSQDFVEILWVHALSNSSICQGEKIVMIYYCHCPFFKRGACHAPRSVRAVSQFKYYITKKTVLMKELKIFVIFLVSHYY